MYLKIYIFLKFPIYLSLCNMENYSNLDNIDICLIFYVPCYFYSVILPDLNFDHLS